MSRSNRVSVCLFWLMVLLGTATLAPCLLLPAWLEYQATLDLRALRTYQVQRREAELANLRSQREHLRTDDAYVLRLAREQLNIEIPGVERIPVEPASLAEPAAAAVYPPLPVAEDELVPELSALVEQVFQRHPLMRMFVRPETRPSLMLIGGGLIVSAIVLLGSPTRAKGTSPRAAP